MWNILGMSHYRLDKTQKKYGVPYELETRQLFPNEPFNDAFLVGFLLTYKPCMIFKCMVISRSSSLVRFTNSRHPRILRKILCK